MQKRVRMVDIAEKMGVSTFTVSKALSGKEGVSEELRAEVRRVAEQMGYQAKNKSRQETVSKSIRADVVSPQCRRKYWDFRVCIH